MPGPRHLHAADWTEDIRETTWRNQPGFGGVVQSYVEAGYHQLLSAISSESREGIILVDYKVTKQISTQAGARARAINLYTTTYMSK
jgi:hypothetical protein